MPSFKKKIAGLIRQISNSNMGNNVPLESDREHKIEDVESRSKAATPGNFIHQYLTGDLKRTQPAIYFGKTWSELPDEEIAELSATLFASYTGPVGGLTQVNRKKSIPKMIESVNLEDVEIGNVMTDTKDNQVKTLNAGNEQKQDNTDNCNEEDDSDEDCGEFDTIAGINNWEVTHDRSYGLSTTLYECHPMTRQNAGEPIADVFAICARANNSILILADGVNWGEKSRIAARCAVHGCMGYLNKTFFASDAKIESTHDIFSALLHSFHAAHNLILEEKGTLTTLCAAVVCQLKCSDKFVVCTCNVGDSLAYVYNKNYGVREITQGSHDIYAMRDMRDALGALGPVDGNNPEVSNLTCSLTYVEKGDLVFLTSDGISDNFDPVVGKFAVPKKTEKDNAKLAKPEDDHSDPEDMINLKLPEVGGFQRHELTLLRMEDLLRNGVTVGDVPCNSAKQLCEALINFACQLTSAKRHILEDPELYEKSDKTVTRGEQLQRRRKVCEKLAMVPGKLDHATVVAYEVGIYPQFRKSMDLTQTSV